MPPVQQLLAQLLGVLDVLDVLGVFQRKERLVLRRTRADPLAAVVLEPANAFETGTTDMQNLVGDVGPSRVLAGLVAHQPIESGLLLSDAQRACRTPRIGVLADAQIRQHIGDAVLLERQGRLQSAMLAVERVAADASLRRPFRGPRLERLQDQRPRLVVRNLLDTQDAFQLVGVVLLHQTGSQQAQAVPLLSACARAQTQRRHFPSIEVLRRA